MQIDQTKRRSYAFYIYKMPDTVAQQQTVSNAMGVQKYLAMRAGHKDCLQCVNDSHALMHSASISLTLSDQHIQSGVPETQALGPRRRLNPDAAMGQSKLPTMSGWLTAPVAPRWPHSPPACQ